MANKLNVSRVIIGISVVSLTLQIVASIFLIPKLNQPVNGFYVALAFAFEFMAFAILAPFTRIFYATQKVRFSYPRSLALLLSSEGFTRLVPFGDFFIHRYYFNRYKLRKGAPLRYITVLYSFALLSLITLFLGFQLAVFLLYPSQISSSFAGKFVLIPLTITLAILALFVLRRSSRLSRNVQKFSRKQLGSELDSPFQILKDTKRSLGSILLMLLPLLTTWLLEGFAYVACLTAFGVDAPLLLGLYAYTFVKMFRFIPIFPGGVGEIEATSVLLFSAYGYAVLPVVTGSILFRFVSYWFPIVMGAISARFILRREYSSNR